MSKEAIKYRWKIYRLRGTPAVFIGAVVAADEKPAMFRGDRRRRLRATVWRRSHPANKDPLTVNRGRNTTWF
jgi:hypothetical protein